MAKILKCASNDDVITLEARDETDALTLKFESPSEFTFQLLDTHSLCCCCISPIRLRVGLLTCPLPAAIRHCQEIVAGSTWPPATSH
jgi:hypothetical protein